ncbi:hypothetical protein C3L33_02843, partial [Rhododendron williamsianum]
MDHQTPPSSPPHVLIFPLPLQGPIKCMLKLAELLCLAGDIHVTFLNTHHNHSRLLRYTALDSRFSVYPQFRFQTISDGLPDDHPRSIDRLGDLLNGLWTVTNPNFKELLNSGGGDRRPVTCVIADGALTFALDVAEEVGIPLIYFETISPCGLWTYFCVHKLIEAGEIPFQGDDLDAPIQSVPGMEGFLRRRDLPSFCRTTDLNDPVIQLAMRECRQVPRSRGLILNTFEDLDGPIGIDIKDTCERGVIEKMIKDLMNAKGDEFRQSMDRLSKLARESINVGEGGSSVCNLNRLIEDIRSMKV